MDGQPPIDGPGERRPARLDRPPSERYHVDDSPGERAEPSRSARSVSGAVIAAIVGGIVIAVGGGLLTITAGLLIVAGVLGWVVAVIVSTGADRTTGRAGRRTTAAAIALGGVALGQLGLWLIARQEGGTLGFVDYLAEVFGLLVLGELALAAAVAWWRAA